MSARLRSPIPRGAERLLRSFQTRDLTVLRPIAALPLKEVEAPEPRGFAWRVGNGFVDATDTPPFKEDVVAFRVAGVGIALQDQLVRHALAVTRERGMGVTSESMSNLGPNLDPTA